MTAGGNSVKNATAHKVNSYYTLAISYCTFCVGKHYFRPWSDVVVQSWLCLLMSGMLLLTGVLMLNLVCRSSAQRQSVLSTLKSVFGRVCSVKLREDVNETVYCFPSTLSDASAASGAVPLSAAAEHLQTVLRTSQQRSASTDVLRLVSKLENLKWH